MVVSKYGCIGAVVALMLAATPAQAHHSFAAFIRTEAAKRSVEGTVKEFALINPHGWLKLVVPEGGGSANWAFEMASATQLQHLGWNADSVHVGDKVTVTYFPLRFGSYGGEVVAVNLHNGQVLSGLNEGDRGYPKQ